MRALPLQPARSLAALVAVALLLALLPGPTASADTPAPRDLTGACGALDLERIAFLDLDAEPAATAEAIRCVSAYEIAGGYADGSFRGSRPVTRAEMARFLDRVLRYAEAHGDLELPPAPAEPSFTDTSGLAAEAQTAIARLEALEVTTGTSPETFSPRASVTRRDMASFLVRLQGVLAEPYAAGADAPSFPDVGEDLPRADDVAAIAEVGIAAGHADGTFRPFAAVTRAQMALFLARHLDENVAAERLPARTVVPDGVGGVAGFRAAWVHLFDDTLKTREGIEALVADLDAAGADAVIAQVARRHDAYYASEVLPPTPDRGLEPGLDVLATLLEVAGEAGLEVHAWISVMPSTHRVYDDLPAPEGWLAAEHGRGAPVADRWVTRTADGQWSDYLDPALPEVVEHVTAIVDDLARYDGLDGIHLDYVRYESARHGYHPEALRRFAAETGRSIPPDPGDRAWSDWRRAQTAGVMTAAREVLDGRDVALSAATIAWGQGPGSGGDAAFAQTRTYRDALQDWPSWAREGLVDLVLPMTYFRAHDADQSRWFEQWLVYNRGLAAEGHAAVVPGVAGYLNAPAAGADQVGRTLRGTGSVAVYSYQQPTASGSAAAFWRDLAATGWTGLR